MKPKSESKKIRNRKIKKGKEKRNMDAEKAEAFENAKGEVKDWKELNS